MSGYPVLGSGAARRRVEHPLRGRGVTQDYLAGDVTGIWDGRFRERNGEVRMFGGAGQEDDCAILFISVPPQT